MALPDYSGDAVREAKTFVFPGCKIEAELIVNVRGYGIDTGGPASSKIIGTGPSASSPERRTVTIYGFPGKASVTQVARLLEGFRVAKDVPYPVEAPPLYAFFFRPRTSLIKDLLRPEKKFSLVSRFLVYFESESEAQRFVRKYHMTRHKSNNGLFLKAAIIY